MKREHLITIRRSSEEDAARKSLVRPVPRRPVFFRRKSDVFITFYDLAQVNTGTVQSPVWTDHPILKSPTYSASPAVSGTLIGVDYEIEQFGNSDYQSFTDSLFDVGAVTEWKNLFRKLSYELNPDPSPYQAVPATYPTNLTVRDQANAARRFMRDHSANIETAGGRVSRAEQLSTYGICWDKKGLEYQNLPKLSCNFQTGGVREWFTASTNDTDFYKVTEVYDPSAPDVSGLEISGKIDVYLVPQVGLFFAAAARAPLSFGSPDVTAGFEVIFAYQVLPRQNYPAFVDPYQNLDRQLLNDIYIGYQKNRDGMVGSQWTGDPAFFTISESSLDPTTFGTAYSYKSCIDNLNIINPYAAPGKHFQSVPGSAARCVRSDPFLMAVLKIKNRFYYVWSVENELDGIGADEETNVVFGYEVESEDYED